MKNKLSDFKVAGFTWWHTSPVTLYDRCLLCNRPRYYLHKDDGVFVACVNPDCADYVGLSGKLVRAEKSSPIDNMVAVLEMIEGAVLTNETTGQRWKRINDAWIGINTDEKP